MKPIILISFLLLSLLSNGQTALNVRADLHPSFLVKRLLISPESDIEVENIQYTGNKYSLGAFSNPSKYNLIKKGIIMSTGHVEDAVGPNDEGNVGRRMGTPGDVALDRIASGPTFDASKLSFEFSSASDSIFFRYFFASEEYPEYVNKEVNDIFIFELLNLSTGEKNNLAVVGNKKELVTVDNINSRKNAEYYIENAYWSPDNAEQWMKEPGKGALALNYQFDGFTNILSTGSAIVPNQKYKITFTIADVGDDLYDSAVFLEEGSFGSGNRQSRSAPKELLKSLNTELIDQSVEILEVKNEIIVRLNIPFRFDSDEIKSDQSMMELNVIARILRMDEGVLIKVEGHTDGMGSVGYNDDLSERRAATVKAYLESKGIEAGRMTSEGFADRQPISDNITESGRRKNRRVELRFFVN